MITSSNIVEFFELYLRPFLEQESRLTKELAADEAIAVYDDPVVRSMDGYEATGRIRPVCKEAETKAPADHRADGERVCGGQRAGAARRNGRPHGQARGDAAASGDDDALDRITCSRKHWIG